LKLVLIIAAILLIVGFAQASTLTVCPSGCDYTSIQTAVYAAHPNDTIEAHSGTYNESVILTKNIMFNGADTGSGEPIVNGDLYKNGFNMVLRGFSFQSIAGLPSPENMTTPNTTIYWIEKAFENPSNPNAIANLDKILKTNPNDAWAWFRLGWVLYDSERYDEATDAYNKSIKLDPYFASPWNEIGNDFYSLNKYDKALEAYENAIQLEPDNGLYWSNKGGALKALGRTSESDIAYAKAKELEFGGSTGTAGTTTISSNATGTNILDHSMASNVDESTNRVITRTYKFTSTDSKACSWLSLGNVEAGMVEWRWYSPDGNLYKTGSVDIPPNPSGGYWPSYNIWYYINIARDIPADLPGDWHVDVYRNGSKILTEYFSIGEPQQQVTTKDWVDQGNALYDQGKYDEAVQAYDKAIEVNPENADTWYNKGLALERQNKYNEAIQAYDKAIELDPKDADAWSAKGAALNSQDKYDEAIQAYDKAIEIDPRYADAWEGKGVALDGQGKYAEAVQAYEKATEINPQYAYAWNNKGVALREQGKYAESIQALDKAIEIDPQATIAGVAWNNKGRALKLLGKTSESDAAFAKSKELLGMQL
jgi:tetratricopeptide (TPR) repeat protein